MRIPIVISSCLLGNAVRYDGQHQFHAQLNSLLSDEFHIIPVCPEVLAGLGVPRPPVQLVYQDDVIHARGVDDPALDVTAALVETSQSFLNNLNGVCGFILKARSPSCGVHNTPLFNEDLLETGKTNGLFAMQVQTDYPDIPITDESCLTTEEAISQFLNRVRDYSSGLSN